MNWSKPSKALYIEVQPLTFSTPLLLSLLFSIDYSSSLLFPLPTETISAFTSFGQPRNKKTKTSPYLSSWSKQQTQNSLALSFSCPLSVCSIKEKVPPLLFSASHAETLFLFFSQHLFKLQKQLLSSLQENMKKEKKKKRKQRTLFSFVFLNAK
jgi:hypothetical protein